MRENAFFTRITLTEQVAEHLCESIKSGTLLEGPNFPSSRCLADKYGVSHNIMLKVLRQLRDEKKLHLPSKRKGYQLNVEYCQI